MSGFKLTGLKPGNLLTICDYWLYCNKYIPGIRRRKDLAFHNLFQCQIYRTFRVHFLHLNHLPLHWYFLRKLGGFLSTLTNLLKQWSMLKSSLYYQSQSEILPSVPCQLEWKIDYEFPQSLFESSLHYWHHLAHLTPRLAFQTAHDIGCRLRPEHSAFELCWWCLVCCQ